MQKRASLFSLVITVSFTSSFSLADDTWRISEGAPLPLSDRGKNLSTDYYRAEQFGIFTMSSTLWHEQWLYPTHNDVNPAGVFSVAANKVDFGDFDGDGDEDVVINWSIFPHVLVHPPIAPTILLNNNGALQLPPANFMATAPERIFAFHAGAADFNLDGRDDVVGASGGVHFRNDDGSLTQTFEPIPLMLSSTDGMTDGSARIAGQELGGLPGAFTYAHDLAVGDLSGDGIADFYQGRHLFVSDGTGKFEVRNDLLPVEATLDATVNHFLMSSAIGDLDNDGVSDLVIGIADGQWQPEPQSGWIFLSAGSGSLRGGTQQLLPHGLYGLLNTKHNSMRLADINNDGRLDILIGQTKGTPYYEGRSLQLLVNHGNGVFVDETSTRLEAGNRPDAWGEGMIRILDINGDGHLDIVDQAGSAVKDSAILVNDGSGVFARMPMTELPILQDFHVAEFASWEGEVHGFSDTKYLFPIDLDGNGIASFLVEMGWPLKRWPMVEGDATQSTYYVLRPVQPYLPVAGEKRANDIECILNWVASSYPEIFPGAGTPTDRLDAYKFRYYADGDSYLAVRGRTLFGLAPSLGGIVDAGGIDQYLPAARAAGCNK